jgi:hypothetical protein
VFDAVTHVGRDGWSAELRIPYSTLRYSNPPSQTWTLLVFRRLPREEQYSYANARIPKDANCFQCYAQELAGLSGLPQGRELTVTPQLTLRRTTDRTNGTGAPRENDVIVGADVKYRPRPDLVFDSTINPDFSQWSSTRRNWLPTRSSRCSFRRSGRFFLRARTSFRHPLAVPSTRARSPIRLGARASRVAPTATTWCSSRRGMTAAA